MPEMRFRIRWPDGQVEECYSPSTIVADHFVAGARYPLTEFVALSRAALTAASERVRARFGMGCSRAAAQLAAIERTAERHAAAPGASVLVESLH